jgi:hypothetical protein
MAHALWASRCPCCGEALYVSGLDSPPVLTCLGACEQEAVRDALLGGRELEGFDRRVA